MLAIIPTLHFPPLPPQQSLTCASCTNVHIFTQTRYSSGFYFYLLFHLSSQITCFPFISTSFIHSYIFKRPPPCQATHRLAASAGPVHSVQDSSCITWLAAGGELAGHIQVQNVTNYLCTHLYFTSHTHTNLHWHINVFDSL